MRRWGPLLLMLLIGAVLAARLAGQGSWTGVVITVVACAVVAMLLSPLTFPRPLSEAEARRRSAHDGRPIVYWRPGCPYCLRLRTTLGREARRAYWVDIWRDPEAAAAVRAVADGNETVPTVVLGGEAHVNPDPSWLKARLTGR